MGAQNVPELFVAAFVNEVQVDLAQRRQETVGVVDDVLNPVVVGEADPVVRDGGGAQDTDPDAVKLMGELDQGAVGCLDNHRGSQRPQRAHGYRPLVRVRAQQGMGVIVFALDHQLQVAVVYRPG